MSAEQILLVNPRRRRRRRKALARRRRRAVSRVTRRRRRLRNPIGAYMANPRRRRRRASSIRRRRRLRNPRALGGFSVGSVVRQLVPAATGAVGAVGLDVALGYLPIPDQYKTGWLGTGVKVAGAIGLGMLAGRFVGREKGRLFTAGALTVIAYQVLRNLAVQALPTVKGLSGYQDFADYNLGAYMRPSLPAPANNAGMGAYMNPAGILNGIDGGYTGQDDYYN